MGGRLLDGFQELAFDVALSADEVANPKPDPEIFLQCASRLGVFRKDVLSLRIQFLV